MLKKFILTCIVSILVSFAYSQSAEKVSEVVNTDEVRLGQAAYFSAVALGLCGDDAGEADAVDALKREGILKDTLRADDTLTVKCLAWLLVNTYKTDRGLFLRLFPTERYAFRELKTDGIIPMAYDPYRTLNGRETLALITDCINFYEVRTLDGE